MADEIILINVPGPGDPSSVEVVRAGDGTIVVPEATDVQELVNDSITVHAMDPTPHPAYDDLPSLTLLFENGLV